jgi:23S rRNA (guanine745-N1)-methyltransferase
MSGRALAAVVPSLRCPVCADPVRLDSSRLGCDRGHSFDLARQGYVTLTTGHGGPGTGDSAAMVAARERFLGGGHYEPLAATLATLAARHVAPAAVVPGQGAGPGLAVDLAGGTGYYLARVLDALAGAMACVSTCRRRRCAGPPVPTRGRPRSARTPGSRCRSPAAAPPSS